MLCICINDDVFIFCSLRKIYTQKKGKTRDSPEERGMALVVGHGEEAAVWGEVQALGSVYGFPLEHGEVGEHCEAGDMNLK